MSMSETSLPSLLSSRICHDLASPISAIQNSLELLEMSGLPDSPEVALLRDSISAATARVEFFRIAYGRADDADIIAHSEVQRVLNTLYGQGRITIDWSQTEDMRRREAKRVFLLLQCLETALPVGGNIRIQRNGDVWQLFATAKKLAADLSLFDHLKSDAKVSDISANQVQFALAHDDMMNLPSPPCVTINGTDITLTFSQAC